MAPDKVQAFATFEKDLLNDLIPYIEKNYAALTDHENRAIAGKQYVLYLFKKWGAKKNATEFQKGMHAVAPPDTERHLAPKQMMRLPAADLTVLCLEGELWLTRDGDQEDYLLRPGQSLAVRRDDQAALQALRPSRLRLNPRPTPAG